MGRQAQSLADSIRAALRRSKLLITAASGLLTAIGLLGAALGIWSLVAAVLLILIGSLPPLVLFAIARLKYHASVVPAATAAVLATVSRPSARAGEAEKKGQSGAGRHPAQAKLPTFSIDEEWARRCRVGFSGKFETYALQSRSVRARDVFANAASEGLHDWASLSRILRLAAAGYAGPLEAVKAFDAQYLRSLARLIVNQRSQADDLYDALTIYEVLVKAHPATKNGRSDNYLLLDAASELGNTSVFRRALRAGHFKVRDPFHAAFMSANLLGGVDHPMWLATVNAPFLTEGVEPLEIMQGEGPPYDRLHAEAPARSADDPLISVIVPTFEADHRLRTAIRSLTTQTWQNIEIIIVDDCSSEPAKRVIEDIAATDDRIRVIHQNQNRGSYAARNAGLAAARGKYVTCHDDDDWSHPRKLETQGQLLESEDSFVATMSRHVRSSDQLQFTRININPSVPQPNFSSLMFRREQVVERCGRWDEARKGADAEFKERLEAAFDLKIPVVGEAPMSLTRTRIDSLTAGEMVRGYVDPRRVAYMRGFQRWHATRPEDWSLKETGQRPFHAPPGIDRAAPHALDLVFATDFRFPGGTSALTLAEVFASLDAGYRVGLLQMESPLNSWTAPLVDGYWQALEGGAVMLTLPDTVEAELTVIRHPSVLQFADGLPVSGLTTRDLMLVVNHLPVMRDGLGSVFDVEEAVSNAARLFRTAPTIVPESGVTRSALESVVAPAHVSPDHWPGFVADAWFGEPRTVERRKPVVGRHGRDNWIKWPASVRNILHVYDQPDLFETRILGGVGSIAEKLPAETVARWRVFEFNEVEPRDFVKDLDFWVFFHHRDSQESFGMAIAEAMAAGAVVILPPYLEKTFGEGALYCTPKQVPELVARYWADAGEYFMQSKRGIETARTMFSAESFLQRVRSRLTNR